MTQTGNASNAPTKVRKVVDLPQALCDDFMKITATLEQDFQKRVRLLIKQDIELNRHLLKIKK